MKKQSTEIALKGGRITLFWPLTLHLKEPPQESSVVDYTSDAFGRDIEEAYRQASGEARKSLWQPVIDPIEHIAPPVIPGNTATPDEQKAYETARLKWENETYAEAVYFHEFIQAFLYRKAKPDQLPSFRLFRRNDIAAVKVKFSETEKTVKVERMNLYIFRTGVAIFTVDLVIETIDHENALSGWMLSDFLDFHDLVRRAYAPFFGEEDGKRVPGHLVAKQVEWLGKSGEPIHNGTDTLSFHVESELGQAEAYLADECTAGGRHPPIFRHWRALLPEQLPIAAYDAPRKPINSPKSTLCREGRWHQVLDERMPSMATISLADELGGRSRFDAITDGDWERLCFVDTKGDSSQHPYNQGFLTDFAARNCYDRFLHYGTRYLLSGYSMVAAIVDKRPEPFIETHMKRHYYQMGLLVHMEIASLLGFSGQISRAVQQFGNELGPKSEVKFEQAMSAIQEQFLLFVHRFRFTGVSNQVQGQELFEMWRSHLKADALFADVDSEVSVANSYLQARADRRSSDAGEKLTMIGTVGVLIGVILGLLSMNFLFTPELWLGEGKESVGLIAAIKNQFGSNPLPAMAPTAAQTVVGEGAPVSVVTNLILQLVPVGLSMSLIGLIGLIGLAVSWRQHPNSLRWISGILGLTGIFLLFFGFFAS